MNFYSRLLCIFAIVVSYMPFSAPTFYANYIAGRSLTKHFAAVHFASGFITMPIILTNFFANAMIKYSSYDDYIFIMLTILLVAISIVSLVGVQKYKPMAWDGGNTKLQKRRLVSFAIYGIATVLLTLPNFG
ncbi:unnamed protein product [Gongylonema pulchrum]|uniref:DUF998 domain-containing protein n=1 Tax=Gongylonema pulchrum TaxID=637853 RepID=A0A183E2J3_9BILA|nr:unnamed protein product [Gongylonema pulchrum]